MPPPRPHACIALHLERTNENLAIAHLVPLVAKVDFGPMACALHQYLVDQGVHAPEIQPCPIGDAFVQFSSPLERQGFLQGPSRHFGHYHLSFIKHDVGVNVHYFIMDREVWLMLVCYPTDGRSLSLVGKAICGFSQFQHLHPSMTVARIIVKALVNREQDIPDDFVVSMGEGQSTRTFIVPIYILTAQDIAVGGD